MTDVLCRRCAALVWRPGSEPTLPTASSRWPNCPSLLFPIHLVIFTRVYISIHPYLHNVQTDLTPDPPARPVQVGAALLCGDADRSTVTGCNVENASYGLTVCAERTAVVKAVSDGLQDYLAVAIAADLEDEFVGPCGMCR